MIPFTSQVNSELAANRFAFVRFVCFVVSTAFSRPNSGAFVTGQQLAHRPRHALVQQDVHVGVGASKADSERSRSLQAISRVTDGKHSRNSSKV